jgi:hypothetical protein
MKKIVLFFALCLILASFAAGISRAQDAEEPQLYFLMEEFVAPSDLVQFWTVQQEAFDVFDKVGAKATVWAYQTDQSSFYWAFPIKSFADLDELFANFMKIQQLSKENGFDSDVKFRDLSNTSQSVLRWAPELSLHPEGSSEEGKNYHEWTFMYVKSGHEKEAAEIGRKYIEFYKRIGSDYSYDIYQVIFGEHTPCWILEEQAVDEVALRQKQNAIEKDHKDELQKLSIGLMQQLRKIETKKGMFLPDWSRNTAE